MKTGLIEKIKSTISCVDYMQTEHHSKISGGRCASFRPGATNPSSLLVNERDWFDFGSGLGGDVIDLAAADKFSGDIGLAVGYLAERWNIAMPDEKIDVKHVEVIFNTYRAILEHACTFYEKTLWKPEHENVVRYLNGRGLTNETIRALRIGWADNPCPYLKEHGFAMKDISDSGLLSFLNRIMIPYLRNGKPVYMLGRASVWPEIQSSNPGAKYMKLLRHEMSEHPIWGLETLRSRAGTVVIAEGIFDAISCWQENFPVVTAVTGAFSGEQKKDLIPALRGRHVIVCMDYDPETHAGQKFTTALATELFTAGISVSACYLTGDDAKKDISMLYAMSPCRKTLNSIFAQSEKWEKLNIRRIADEPTEDDRKKQLYSFLKGCALHFEWPDIAELIDLAKCTCGFNKAWLTELAKQLKRPPSELEVCDMFVEKNDIIFHPNMGFFRYETSRWKRITEFDVKAILLDICGRHASSRLVESSFNLVRTRIKKDVNFDSEAGLLNFPNGMVNIETGAITPHLREYWSLRQMSYCYDPDAECKEWLAFLESVTDGDEAKQNLIQEMFGYCLTRDVRYQKCFCLLGEGSNGKSVLLNVLEAMVGDENTSHVEIAYLNQDFQRIKLLGALVNICNDMNTDVSGTESFLKAIVAGDPITGCYKFRDYIDFSPYCKMVFSANRQPTARDVDYALLRRFCFVSFPVKYVDNPTAANERKKVDNIVDSLLAELPGILNWALRGLKALREQGRFTEPEDQRRLKSELYRLNNPVIAFVEEVIGNGGSHWQARLSRREVYEAYNKWCMETNTKPLSARGFWPRLREVFPMTEIHSIDGWYLVFTEPLKYCGENRGDLPG